MAAPLRVALIGSGSMGRNHARVIAGGPHTELTVVFDPSEDAHAVADQHGAAWEPELDDLGRFDAAVVAAPTEAHFGLAGQVLEAGIPLLVEKPLCPSLAQTQDLVDRSAAKGTPLMCGLLERFNPAVLAALRMLEEPLFVRATRHSPYAPRIRTGVAWDLLVHDVDLVVRFFGGAHPERFDVEVGRFHPASAPGAEDVVEANLRFAHGIASVSASRLGQIKVRTLVIHELDRMLEIDLLRRGLTAYRHSTLEASDAGFSGFRQTTEIEVPEIGGAEPLVAQLAHFVDLVEGRADADAERAGILPAHRVVDEVLALRTA